VRPITSGPWRDLLGRKEEFEERRRKKARSVGKCRPGIGKGKIKGGVLKEIARGEKGRPGLRQNLYEPSVGQKVTGYGYLLL